MNIYILFATCRWRSCSCQFYANTLVNELQILVNVCKYENRMINYFYQGFPFLFNSICDDICDQTNENRSHYIAAIFYSKLNECMYIASISARGVIMLVDNKMKLKISSIFIIYFQHKFVLYILYYIANYTDNSDKPVCSAGKSQFLKVL